MKTRKARSTRIEPVAVAMAYTFPEAGRVAVAGTFNDWNPAATVCQRDGGGTWHTALKLAPGRYQYRLLVDDVWIDPPDARELVDNGLGSRNAVLEVASRG